MTEEINIKDLGLIDDELKAIKKKNENYAIIMAFVVQLFWAFNSLQLKSYPVLFPKEYSHHSLAFWRFTTMAIVGYYLCKRQNIDIIPFTQINYKFWFFARNIGIYAGLILWVLVTMNLRLSTCQCISGCHPILVLYLSIFLLKEKFYMRYLSGIVLCIIGTFIIVLNEKSSSQPTESFKGNTQLGVFLGLMHLICFSTATLSQKVLCNEKMSSEVQNFYLGFVNAIIAFVFIVFENYYGLSNLLYVAYSASNSFVFYLACYYSAECLKYMPVSKFIPITYMCTIYTFLIGIFILNEPVYFTDLIGSLLIVSFQIYNVWVPIEQD